MDLSDHLQCSNLSICKYDDFTNELYFLGITSKLEYIKDIGVDAIWLSPMFQSPMYDFGYDIADFYAVHDEYGTMEDFEALMARANELGKKN